jgi:hypothetical protein
MSYKILKDPAGNNYMPKIGNTPPPVGSPVTVYTPRGPQQGTIWSGGYAVPNKK